MKNKINKNIVTFVMKSIKTLQTGLSASQIAATKTEFQNIRAYKIASSDSYFNLVQNGKIPPNQVDIEKAFLGIGNLLAVPARTGSTNLLNDSYAADIKDTKEVSFLGYQLDVAQYVSDQIEDIYE